jgi:hypothetical protein
LAQDDVAGRERQGAGGDDAARHVNSFNLVFDRSMEIMDRYFSRVHPGEQESKV